MIEHEIPRQLFITGTDTGVGKTVVSAILMAGLEGKYWKPVQSGLEEMTDTDWIRAVTGLPENHFYPETCRLQRPLSPHASAAAEGIRIDLESFRLPDTEEHLIVEGAGGIMVPLNETHLMLDLMKKLAIPVLLVARSELGTINHTLLSLEQMRRHGLEVFGVVMNGPKNPGNREAIEHFGKVKVLAEIEPMDAINAETLKRAFLECGSSAIASRCGSSTSALQITQWHHSPLHAFLPDSFYIITASTFHKAPIFRDEEHLQILQNTLLKITESFGWQLQAWAIFPNHYHFIAQAPDDGATLSRMIQRLHSLTARQVNELDQASGRKVWFQYWDTCLTYEESYLARLNYVHNNAVKHNITTAAADYPFCSAGWFENQADSTFRRKVQSFQYDRIKIPDDF
jgi:dethiobiotin synthase